MDNVDWRLRAMILIMAGNGYFVPGERAAEGAKPYFKRGDLPLAISTATARTLAFLGQFRDPEVSHAAARLAVTRDLVQTLPEADQTGADGAPTQTLARFAARSGDNDPPVLSLIERALEAVKTERVFGDTVESPVRDGETTSP